jgi:hypothetical protein
MTLLTCRTAVSFRCTFNQLAVLENSSWLLRTAVVIDLDTETLKCGTSKEVLLKSAYDFDDVCPKLIINEALGWLNIGVFAVFT